jgi:hypothetical protein
MRISRRQVAFYPFFFALYPLLNLYVTNFHLVRVPGLLQPMILALVVAVIALIAANLALRADVSAPILASIVIIGIFYYGSFHDLIGIFAPEANVAQRHAYILPGWVILLLLVGLLVTKKSIGSVQANSYLNFLATILLVIILFPIVKSSILRPTGRLVLKEELPSKLLMSPDFDHGRKLDPQVKLDVLPDVYYIILDGYGRSDVFQDYYGFDNSTFLRDLTAKGFYIASESRSNYSHTFLSLASSLNMSYLDVSTLYEADRVESIGAVLPLVEDNSVIRQFNNLGYTTIHFASGWEATDHNELADINFTFSSISQFNSLFVNSTILRPVAPWYSQQQKRRLVLASLDKLKEVPEIESPTFSFIHLLVPHPPYIFDQEGDLPDYAHNSNQNWFPKQGYIEQLIFVNRQVEGVIDSILAQSDSPPIIVIQGDHGPAPAWVQSRMSILNAYYLPGNGAEFLYSDITPVNTFRLVLALYFGKNSELLQDESFFSVGDREFELCQVDDIYLATSNPSRWNAQVEQILKDNGYRLEVNGCPFHRVVPLGSGFHDVEWYDKTFFRWAEQSLRLRWPVEAGEDYILRAGVNHILPGSEQELLLLIDNALVDSAPVPVGASEVAFVVPAKYIGLDSFVNVNIEHSRSTTGFNGDRRNLSVQYRWLEWSLVGETPTNPRFDEDIIVTDGLLLGDGWYSLEVSSESFRWVNNDAEVIVKSPDKLAMGTLSLELEPGPSLGRQFFELELLDETGRIVSTAKVQGRKIVQLTLPPGVKSQKFRLHVEGSEQQDVPNDSRTLNFRVFWMALN